jgi:hypothetical protein
VELEHIGACVGSLEANIFWARRSLQDLWENQMTLFDNIPSDRYMFFYICKLVGKSLHEGFSEC